MKKALSILLIIAAFFGFYGGGVTIKDVLDCKAYWEEEGEKTTADLNKLEDGLDELGENTEAYLDGVEQVADGEVALAEGEKTLAKGKSDYAAGLKKYLAGLKALKEGRKSLESLQTLMDGLTAVQEGFKNSWMLGYEQLKAGRLGDVTAANPGMTLAMKVKQPKLEDLMAQYNPSKAKLEQEHGRPIAADTDQSLTYKQYADHLSVLIKNDVLAHAQAAFMSDYNNFQDIKNATTDEQKIAAVAKSKSALLAFVNANVKDEVKNIALKAAILAVAEGDMSLYGLVEQLRDQALGTMDESVDDVKALKSDLIPGMKSFVSGYTQLADGQQTIAGGLAQCLSGMLGNKDMKKALMDKADQYGMTMQVLNWADPQKSALLTCDFPDFQDAMTKVSYLISAEIMPQLKQTQIEGQATLEAGEKELAKGAKDLAAGRQKLANGEKDLAAGRQTLADGKSQLAQYEDGEQQIRDGLATLMGTEPNGGLKSIADRIGPDEDFSLADGNLDFDAGYNGVDVGRAYSADSSVLITKELTQRAVGFGIGIFAGLIAIVAAILGFKKKYKGAAVLGLLAAVAAGVGAMVAKKAGLEFSAIAGSALGIVPMASLAILAGIAVVHAIAYFTAPKEA